MDVTSVLTGGALIGVLAAFWSKFKDFIWKFVSLLIEQSQLSTEETVDHVLSYLVENYKRSITYDKAYKTCFERTTSDRYEYVSFEEFGQSSMIFWDGWRPIIYARMKSSKDSNSSSGSYPYSSGNSGSKVTGSTITVIRWTIDINKLIKSATDAHNARWTSNIKGRKEQISRFAIHHIPSRTLEPGTNFNDATFNWFDRGTVRLLTHDRNSLRQISKNAGKCLETLIFPNHVYELIEEIRHWRNSETWYKEKGIPWKRGWCLYGPPGTGKTALARAFAEDLDMPIYVYDLAELTNTEFVTKWRNMYLQAPCIALIEDIDNVFHGRENVARQNPMLAFSGLRLLSRANSDSGSDPQTNSGSSSNNSDKDRSGPLNFDVFINCLDGVDRNHGVFTIITTNDFSKIDEALGRPVIRDDGKMEYISTRPGRIDKIIELTYMEPENKRKLAARILGDYEEPYREMLKFIDDNQDLKESPAQFQERCAQIALSYYWQQMKNKEKEALAKEADILSNKLKAHIKEVSDVNKYIPELGNIMAENGLMARGTIQTIPPESIETSPPDFIETTPPGPRLHTTPPTPPYYRTKLLRDEETPTGEIPVRERV